MPHITHTGETVDGERLNAARNKVADDWAALARAIRAEDCYARHVTDAEKEANLSKMLSEAELIRVGRFGGFTIWQRINTELTGECVALLKR